MRWGVFLSVGVLLFASPVRGQRSQLIEAPELLQLLHTVRAEIALVGEHLKAKPIRDSGLSVRKAGSREAYSQAVLLHHKTRALVSEQTLRAGQRPNLPTQPPTLADVFSLSKESLNAVRAVKAHLGIEKTVTTVVRDNTALADEVYRELVRCNRGLDQLVSAELDLVEVQGRTDQAVAYAMRLLLSFSGQRIPVESPLEGEQKLEDVLAVLLDCRQLEQRIANQLGLSLAEVNLKERAPVSHSEGEELSALVLSGVRGLYQDANVNGAVLKAVRKREPTLDQVVKRGNLLRAYLTRISSLLQENRKGA